MRKSSAVSRGGEKFLISVACAFVLFVPSLSWISFSDCCLTKPCVSHSR